MAFDYSCLVADADELIDEFGRDVTLVKTSRTPASATQPWQGTSVSTTLKGRAVFGKSREIARPGTTGDQRLRAQEVLIRVKEIKAEDVATYRHLDDGGNLRRIVIAEEVKPGPTTVVWILELEA